MKNKLFTFGLVAMLSMIMIFFASFEAKTYQYQGDCKKIRPITCTVNGVVVGYGNDCICGGNTCVDNPCSVSS